MQYWLGKERLARHPASHQARQGRLSLQSSTQAEASPPAKDGTWGILPWKESLGNHRSKVCTPPCFGDRASRGGLGWVALTNLSDPLESLDHKS